MERLEIARETHERITGVPTGFTVLDDWTAGLQPSDFIIVAGRPSMGKCLTARTLLDHPLTGERLTIEEYVQRRIPVVFGLSARGEVRSTAVSDWVDSGVQPCFRVQTRTGRSVEVTGHHPFLTVRGWQPLHDLSVGEKIAVPRSLPTFGADTSWSADLVRLLAYFIAEGGLTSTCPRFTNTDPAIVADFRQVLGGCFPAVVLRRYGIDYAVVRPNRGTGMAPNPVTAWLRELGLMGKDADEKRFPACVWQWDRRSLAEFLRALFSCDATIYSIGGYPRIEFAVASKELAEDVHHALVRFGIVAKLWFKKARCWRVEITEPQSVARYQEAIGWIGEKATRCRRVLPRRRSNTGHAPREAWALVRAAASERELPLTEMARRSGERVPARGYNLHAARGIPLNRLSAYAEVLDDDRLRGIAGPDIYWDEIVAIEPIGEHQVYDLTVPDGANFIAQDVCVHNTSLALAFGVNAAIRRDVPIAIFSLEMSKEQLVQRMLCSEAKVNSIRLRTGQLREAGDGRESDWRNLTRAIGRLGDLKIYIDDASDLTAREMRAKCRRLRAEAGLGLVVVDYLQLIRGGGRSENRTQEISEIARDLKSLAREMQVPVVALSQLSRAVERRDDKRPMLSDLRECVVGDTRLIDAATGAVIPIRSVQPGAKVLGLGDRQKIGAFAVEDVWSTGVKPVFTLTTRTGRTVTATANHPFLTAQGWKRLEELAAGDIIATSEQSDLLWEDIRRIEPAGEAEVFDIRIPGCGNFLANGIVAHNSGSIEAEADLVMMLYRSSYYNRGTPADGEEVTPLRSGAEDVEESELLIAKHRNGPVGTVKLAFLRQYARFENLADYE
jgi:replicative DNA helicase